MKSLKKNIYGKSIITSKKLLKKAWDNKRLTLKIMVLIYQSWILGTLIMLIRNADYIIKTTEKKKFPSLVSS